MGAATMDPPAGTVDEEQFDDGAQDVHGGGAGDGEMTLAGGDGQLSFAITGKRPTTSSLRLVGGRVDVEGQFDKGDVIRLYIEARVQSIEFRDEVDAKTGQVVGCERRHKASITGVERAE